MPPGRQGMLATSSALLGSWKIQITNNVLRAGVALVIEFGLGATQMQGQSLSVITSVSCCLSAERPSCL